jgi:hypothetical protein
MMRILVLVLFAVGLPLLVLGIALAVACPSVGPTIMNTGSVAVCSGDEYLHHVLPSALYFFVIGLFLTVAALKFSVFAAELEVGPSEWQLWWLVLGCWKVSRAHGASAELSAMVRSSACFLTAEHAYLFSVASSFRRAL